MNTFTPLMLVAVSFAAALNASSAAERELECTLKFTSEEWSAVYSSAVGEGTVTCKNGASMPVAIRAKGIGITAGKWKITDGTGKFTHLAKIEDALGSYLSVGGDVGVIKAGTAHVLTKGKVSLALAGKGEGFDIGIDISEFRISKPDGKASTPTAKTK